MPVINILVFLAGLVLLVRGADLFVLTSSRIARRFGVSEFVIGLTLVSIGTSIPELASSLAASFQQASGIIMGNILGSNIANIGLIAGTAALLMNIRTEEVMLRRDGYIMLFSSFLLFLFMLDFKISRLEALIFILLYLIYLLFLFEKVKKHEGDIYFKDFMIYIIKFEYIFDLISRINLQARKSREEKQGAVNKTERKNGTEKRTITESETESVTEEYEDIDIDVTEEHLQETSLLTEFFKLIASLAAIIIGANYFVEEAIFFALLLDVPETIIGISLVAVGTSIPELMVTVSAARSDYGGIALGNVIGSNISNILLILGCSGLVHPIMTTSIDIYYVAPFLLIISTLFLLFIRTGWKVKRLEGFVMLLLYLGFMIRIVGMG
ncbi:K+-dependent Na+/Ca+ exchanger related-protein [Methanosarcina thermophila]|uniref:K+-dependent Na+/Ca+ exchanger related-protein n=3 Tax=Methanosarcina thermophila TaxID=2210 RepID=A0A1I6Z6Z8_METTE|nr:calcium/sodium antiporter [Methanosarcina thermophila]ALK06413.1 MAG: sodium:proton exchanger [Methanosarcina sp. 795]AKB11939.1 Sodium/calcium exchanger protein [Methanosarcina thermophila TM-1]AKB14864.1 Sodium/calcium exchanger protein [Methanosarcina thermophila CHTI-55]NLU55939.1 calcium/sodium antiporter [Methanosarcina thermophila]SFT58490.1 K+-dependent Na+/Ca+ exchanger related-protein [Methanosarcina thermophila]